jgi:hypothetical protein
VLDYAEGCRFAYVFSSVDPRALHRYVRAGFRLRPAVRITPRALEPDRAPVGIRVASATEADLAYVASIDRQVRGSTRTDDIGFLLTSGSTLLIDERGGYAVLGPNRIATLGATNESTARRLFGAVLDGFPDGAVRSASWITGEQHWAIEEAAIRRAEIEVHGAVMTKGVAHLPYPYLPNGLFG